MLQRDIRFYGATKAAIAKVAEKLQIPWDHLLQSTIEIYFALLFLWRVNHCNITQSYIFLESQKDYYYYTVGLS